MTMLGQSQRLQCPPTSQQAEERDDSKYYKGDFCDACKTRGHASKTEYGSDGEDKTY